MSFEQLPLLAGHLLKRLGQSNVLDIAEETFTQKIKLEQEQRTRERKAAQIARAMRGKKKAGGGVELLTQSAEKDGEANKQAVDTGVESKHSGPEITEGEKP